MNYIKDTLIKAISGFEDAKVDIYLKFLPKIKKLSYKLNYEEAETDLIIYLLDLINHTEYKKIKDRTDGELINYILVSITNKYKNILRDKINNKVDITYVDITVTQIEDKHDNSDMYNFYTLIDDLSEVQKEIIIGKFLYGYSLTDLSKIIGKSRQTINNYYKKALNLLRNRIKPEA